jgi:hypothetical protein
MTNNVFGITMECKKPHSVGEYYVHRVDVGSSRAFDNPNHLISKNPNKMTPVFDTTLGPNYGFHRGEINRLFLSRSPSVLKIKGDKQGDVSFIRSNYENTRKGQIRLWLERIHGDINTNRGTYINPNRDPSLEVIGATGIPPPSKLPTDFAICYQADNGSEYFYDNVNNKPIHIDRMTGKINDIDFSHRSANDIDKCKSLIRRGENFLFELKTGKKLEQLPLPPKSGISGGRLNKYIKKNDMLLKLILEKMN